MKNFQDVSKVEVDELEGSEVNEIRALLIELIKNVEQPRPVIDDFIAALTQDGTYYVARCKGAVVGALVVRLTEGGEAARAYMQALIVDERFRLRGIGTALVNRAFKEVEARGLLGMSLYVEESNSPAIRFYEKLGYRVAGRHLVADRSSNS